jgi:fucose 4-O-acetylase-like acetyltransferase/lysophospholipase L1-like esterase
MNKLIENNERLHFWDNAKGILIFLVVFGHMLYAYQDIPLIRLIVGGIYSFHMPAFAFASGYLSAKSKSKMSRSLVFLLVAYAVFNTLAILYFYFIEGIPVSLFTPYVSFWYLPALIAWRLLARIVPPKPGIPILLSVVALAVGFSGQIGSNMTIARIICFSPFFLAGVMLPWEQLTAFLKKDKRKGTLLGLLSLALALAGMAILVPRFPRPNEYLMGTYLTPVDALNRVLIFLISGFVITAGLLMISDRRIPLLSSWGRNSLAVFLIHRFITLIAARALPLYGKPLWILLAAVSGTLGMLFVFGNDTSDHMFHRGIEGIIERLRFSTDPARKRENALFRILTLLIAGTVVLLSVFSDLQEPKIATVISPEIPAVHSVLSDTDRKIIDDAVCLAFVGDLILLKGQVVAAYNSETKDYDFSEMFHYAAPYMDADLTAGVFEGPMAGPETGYSSSDYDDGLALQLNFPDSFAEAVKKSGIDLVTLANNHILDKDVSGAYRTLDVLDQVSLMHTGSYRNAKEKDEVLIIEIEGLRVAFLSYTFRSNGYEDEYFMRENQTLTSLITAPDSPFFEESKERVIEDFDRAKALEPDIIVVMPHMGNQFIHETDSYQKAWNDIFIQLGADIVLGDHAHAVQPMEYFQSESPDGTMRQSFVVNCPGNFANSFTQFDGDATSIVKVYVDPADGGIVCASVIPMWTHGTADGYFRALPIFEITRNESLRKQLSSTDMERVREVQSLVTSAMLGVSVPIDQAQDEYFLFEDGYRRQKVSGMKSTLTEIRSEQLAVLSAADTVCFIGDSLTSGSNNGGYPWYEPLANTFPEKEFHSLAAGGLTTKSLVLQYKEELRKERADLFIVAIGANDIRYRDESICAMSPEEYTGALSEMVSLLRMNNPDAKFIFVAPWPALDNDINTPLLPEEKSFLYRDYTADLRDFCEKNDFLFVDPTRRILEQIRLEPISKYMLDHIHPNAGEGIKFYSKAFLVSEE